MCKRYILVLIVLLLIGSRIPMPQPAAAATATTANAPYRYFFETGHSISGVSKQFYDANGGLAIFGLPLTEVITDTEIQLPVQYFERARFELRSSGVGLTRLGSLLTDDWPNPSFWAMSIAPDQDATFYPETEHSVSGVFGQFYQAHGGLAIFGYPISQPFIEVDSSDKRVYTVQYFERARLALSADTGAEVQLGLLGVEYAHRHALSADVLARVPQLNQLGEGTVPFNARGAAGKNMSLAADHLNGITVAPGAVLSFNAMLGEVSTRAGYAMGLAVVKGQIQNDVGGGICMVSTALYQAALRAGLEIVTRQGHSVPLQIFADTPGMDAAVAIPGLDFQLRNDTSTPLLVYVTTTSTTMTVSLWGIGDGRVTTISKPVISNQQATADPVWRYDAALKPGTYQQISTGIPGMDVAVMRTMRDANGRVLRKETIRSHYAPLADSYVYGPDVDPATVLTPTAAPPSATPVPPSATPALMFPSATATRPNATPQLPNPTPTFDLKVVQ